MGRYYGIHNPEKKLESMNKTLHWGSMLLLKVLFTGGCIFTYFFFYFELSTFYPGTIFPVIDVLTFLAIFFGFFYFLLFQSKEVAATKYIIWLFIVG